MGAGSRYRSPLTTGAQYALSVGASVVTLTIPDSANACFINVKDSPIRFTFDGTDPTATNGFKGEVGDVVKLESRDEMRLLEMIRESGTATVDVNYWTEP